MILSGEEYSKKLEGYSDFTMLLLSELSGMDKETCLKATEITATAELTEEQVVKKLKDLKESAMMRKEMK